MRLAPGLYWIDVWSPTRSRPQQPDGAPHWRAWLQANPTVKVLRTEEFPEPLLGGPSRVFYVFELFTETDFPAHKLGRPDRSSRDATSGSVVRKPPPEPSFDLSFLSGIPPLVLLVGLYLWSRK